MFCKLYGRDRHSTFVQVLLLLCCIAQDMQEGKRGQRRVVEPSRRVEEAKFYDASGAKANRTLIGAAASTHRARTAASLRNIIRIGGSMEQGRSSAAESDLRRCGRCPLDEVRDGGAAASACATTATHERAACSLGGGGEL